MTAIVIPIVLGALLNLDRQTIGPFMINRPLVAGLVIGWAVGDVPKGIWMGMSVELLWLSTMPLGGALTPNAGLAVTAALTGWAAQGLWGQSFPPPGAAAPGGGLTEAGLVLSFLTIAVWARLFTHIDRLARKVVPTQVTSAINDLAAGREPHFFRRNLTGLWVTFLASLGFLTLAAAVNALILNLAAAAAPGVILANLGLTFTFIPFLGLMGMAVSIESKSVTHYLGGLLAGLLVLSSVLS